MRCVTEKLKGREEEVTELKNCSGRAFRNLRNGNLLSTEVETTCRSGDYSSAYFSK